MKTTLNRSTITVEVRSAINDNVVIAFEKSEHEPKNAITAGYDRICKTLGISRAEAERRYYVNA